MPVGSPGPSRVRAYVLNMGARLVNVLLGLWLFLSPFLWLHSPAQRVRAWTVGILVVGAALAGLAGLKAGRLVNAALGGYLIVSALFLPRTLSATFWNHLLVGFALALFAFTSRLTELRGRRADV